MYESVVWLETVYGTVAVVVAVLGDNDFFIIASWHYICNEIFYVNRLRLFTCGGDEGVSKSRRLFNHKGSCYIFIVIFLLPVMLLVFPNLTAILTILTARNGGGMG